MKFKVGDFVTYAPFGSVYKIIDFNTQDVNLLSLEHNELCSPYNLKWLNEYRFEISTENEIAGALSMRLRK